MRTIKPMLLSSALSFAMLMAPVSAFAEEEAAAETTVTNTDYKYELDAEGNAKLYDFLISDTFTGELTIPTEVDGHPVNYVGNACYMNAEGITAVTIPATLTDMGDSVFLGCTSITEFRVEEGNSYYSVKDGVLMADDGGFLVAYPAGRTDASYTTPEGVDEIAPGAFGYSVNLHEINISEGVQFIDNLAFAYSGIETANVAGTVYQIDDYAFAYCDALREVNLGKGIEKIYHAAFAYDKSLTQITIPNTVTLIGQYCFCGTGLTCVTIPNSLENIDFCAFGYDTDFNAISDFVIYGETGTMAEQYCTASDEENDYENHFTFVAVKDASKPYELGLGELDNGEETPDTTEALTDESGETVAATESAANEASMTEKIGAGLSDNKRMQLILGIGGGVLVTLAVVLIVAFSIKPKKKSNSGDKNDAE